MKEGGNVVVVNAEVFGKEDRIGLPDWKGPLSLKKLC